MIEVARTFVRVGLDVHELFARRPVTVGRSRECDIVLDEDMASRHHCRLELIGGVVHVKDLDSRNGILINGERVAGTREAFHGDVLNIGHTTLFILRQRHSPRGRAVPSANAPANDATSQGTSVVDILAGGAEEALQRSDLLAAEASTRYLLTAIRGCAANGGRVTHATVDRAIAIANRLAEQTGDRSLLLRALELEPGE